MFTLNSSDNSFKSRQANVFDCLGDLEKEQAATPKNSEESETDFKKPSTPEPDFPKISRGHPGRRSNDTHDRDRGHRHRKDWDRNSDRNHRQASNSNNRSKWTRYDLSDVSTDQLSDHSNTAVAFSFLEERRKAREGQTDEKTLEEGGKIMFKKKITKPECTKDKSSSETDKESDKTASFVGGKRRMPEYVIGSDSKKTKKTTKDKNKVAGGNVVSLSHLDDEEEED